MLRNTALIVQPFSRSSKHSPDTASCPTTATSDQPDLTAAAQHLGVWPSRICELELGRRPNDELAARYHTWPNTA
jgi:hypothetical protein